VDESPFGVFDLAGSATEWCDATWGGGESARRLAGSSWAQARRDLFKVTGGSGAQRSFASAEIGFRLVVEPADRGR
jgi:formylglycine-generating enzyme required for sulfatase activity